MTRSILLLAALAAPAAAQSGDFIPHTDIGGAAALSKDGMTVLGHDGSDVWLWTEAGGAVYVGGGDGAVAFSNDTQTILGNRINAVDGFDNPAIWTAANGWQDLGGLPNQSPPSNSHASSYDISADGSVAVGLGWYSDWKARGFRWDATNGMVELPQMGTRSSRASTISGDGQWIGGWDEHDNGTRRASLWDANMNQTLFLQRPENVEGYGEIYDINADGSVIVGSDIMDSTFFSAGYVWTAQAGVINFGQVPGVDINNNYNWAAAASEDGSVVIGGNWDLWQNTTFATIWTQETGVMFLSDYLTGLGVTGLEDYQLANATDISADGTRILGWGVQFNPTFQFIWWEAQVPNCDGGTANFCVTTPNSVDTTGAVMGSNGFTSVAANKFEITASPVPDQPGLFFFSSATQNPAPLGNGNLCIGNGQKLYRLPVEFAAGNVLSHQIDFASNPAIGRLLPGTVWHFQAWYRDPAAGGAGFNLTDGMSVTFCD